MSIPARGQTIPSWSLLRQLGHEVHLTCDGASKIGDPDVIIGMGVGAMEETYQAVREFAKARLYCYNWDTYEWVWTRPRPGEYDYRRYGELLKQANEVWVPSRCTGLRTQQWWGIDNWRVILSSCPKWDYPNVRDDGYVLCTLRPIPDPWWGAVEKACDQLGIPYQMTLHEQSFDAYQNAVAGCRFLVSPLYELSTGGLSLLEGYRLGKPCLLNDSPWHGGRDYFGKRAEYFPHGQFEMFKQALQRMYDRPPQVDREECRRWVDETFADDIMVEEMLCRINKFA